MNVLRLFSALTEHYITNTVNKVASDTSHICHIWVTPFFITYTTIRTPLVRPTFDSYHSRKNLNFHFFQAIVAMEFDSNGSLLLTCDRLGNYFNLFRIVPHPAGSCYASVHHLYSLYRGDTPGSVQVRLLVRSFDKN